ncbi:amino acid ABC transporter substrate-binding protein [Lactococcus hodotermopsidis]|uniref:Amino acid ABC transporter substrate-binding protein n=1 Tax=Pseudolactococcus hodotermopsidis TaxID=2709157 RepID=A0A6A0BB02_9LACT|nr:transporter substrate-binding domain-containing protein [Lactococcus hodotermopsidis]GFH42619.1 amino acid ABC transporter substrate-binding protein [Lactococcus hodotermopsidis]
MKKFKKLTLGVLTLATLALVVTACGKDSSNKADGDKKKETVVVGTGAYPKPYTYVDDKDGELKGFDIDLLKDIYKDNDDYEVKFEKTEFATVLSGLDADRYQIGANAFAKTADREEKYYFSDPIYRNPLALIVPEDSDIKSFADIAGKTTEGEAAVSYTVIIEQYNKTHEKNPVKLNYTELDQIQQFGDVESGKIDFKLESAIIANAQVKAHGLKLKVIEIPAEEVKERSAFSFYIFPKTPAGEKTRDFVNKRIQALYDDGAIEKLSQEYFDGDYAVDPSTK